VLGMPVSFLAACQRRADCFETQIFLTFSHAVSSSAMPAVLGAAGLGLRGWPAGFLVGAYLCRRQSWRPRFLAR